MILIKLTPKQKEILTKLKKSRSIPWSLVNRSQIILLSCEKNNSQIAKELKMNRKTIRKWRNKWINSNHILEIIEASNNYKILYIQIIKILSDEERSGRKLTFTNTQIALIIDLACEKPSLSNRPISNWTIRELTDEIIKRGIVSSISKSKIRTILKSCRLQPHKTRYWLNSKEKDTVEFKQKVKYVCEILKNARELYENNINLISCDEKTGIQALETIHHSLPMKPGIPELIEYEYKRHGTLGITTFLHMGTGKIISNSVSRTRKAQEFIEDIKITISLDPQKKWIFLCDQLNTHKSEELVRFVADYCNIDIDLGIKGRKCILKNMKTRSEFLSDESHQIRFIYTPKHTSWLNPIESWFGILSKKLLKRTSFNSLKVLAKKITLFIAYFNDTMGKPIEWKYSG